MCNFSLFCQIFMSQYLILFFRTPHLITRRAALPAGPGTFLLERPSWRHERGLPRRKAALLRSHHGPGPVLPCQHSGCVHRGEQTGERLFSLISHLYFSFSPGVLLTPPPKKNQSFNKARTSGELFFHFCD